MATVQSVRAPLASTIVVDTVLGINPTRFAATMGTPHTFTDPVTSETITVISEATAVDFIGHVDGANLEIDTIAPGYTDAGSAVGDIIIIRPTTQYADNLAAVIDLEHEDTGAHAKEIITSRTEDTAPVTGDFVLTYDASATSLKKAQLGNITPYKADKSVLTVDSNPYKFSAYRSTAWNTTNGGGKVPFNAEEFDTNNNFDSTTNYRYTAPVSGYYQFNACVGFDPGDGAGHITYLWKNGALFKSGSASISYAGPFHRATTVSAFVYAAAGDYFEIYFYGNGSAGNYNSDTWFNGFLVSRT